MKNSFFFDVHHIYVIRFGFSQILSVNFIRAPLYLSHVVIAIIDFQKSITQGSKHK
jgi:hypothetical protein